MPPPTWMALSEPQACVMGAAMPAQNAPTCPRYHKRTIAPVNSESAPQRYAQIPLSSVLLTTILFWPPSHTWGPGTSCTSHQGTPQEMWGARPYGRTGTGSSICARCPAAVSRRTRRTVDRRRSSNIDNPAVPTSKREDPHLFPRGKMGVRAV